MQPSSARIGVVFIVESLVYLVPAMVYLLLSTPIAIISTYLVLKALPPDFWNEEFGVWGGGFYLLLPAYYIGVALIAYLMRLAILTARRSVPKFDKIALPLFLGFMYCAICIAKYLDWKILLIIGLPILVLIVRIAIIQSKIQNSPLNVLKE